MIHWLAIVWMSLGLLAVIPFVADDDKPRCVWLATAAGMAGGPIWWLVWFGAMVVDIVRRYLFMRSVLPGWHLHAVRPLDDGDVIVDVVTTGRGRPRLISAFGKTPEAAITKAAEIVGGGR